MIRSLLAALPADFLDDLIHWDPSPALQDVCRKIAFFLALIWLVSFLSSHALPKKTSPYGALRL